MLLSRSAMASVITIGLNVAYIADVLRLGLGSAALLIALPYLLANLASVAMLVLSLGSKPIRTDDRWVMVLVATLASNMAAVMHFAGVDLVNPSLVEAISLPAQIVTMLLVPFYVLAVMTLGRQLTVVPEARKLITRGPYRFSRHPLYATYIVWHVLQIAVAQTLVVAALSVVMVVLLGIRAVGEESLLANAFPDEYADYRRRVGWFGKWTPGFAARLSD